MGVIYDASDFVKHTTLKQRLFPQIFRDIHASTLRDNEFIMRWQERKKQKEKTEMTLRNDKWKRVISIQINDRLAG